MVVFKGKSIDSKYEHEHLWLKTISGTGFNNNSWGESYIYYDGEWIEVDKTTVEIIQNFKTHINEIKKGDYFLVNEEIHTATYDAHQNFDEPDEPWIVYDENNNGWFEEDINSI